MNENSINAQSEADPKNEKRGLVLGRLLLWALALVFFYVLSIGPIAMLESKGKFQGETEDAIFILYRPVEWAYEETPLHRPIGLYLHLWSTNFDQHGDVK